MTQNLSNLTDWTTKSVCSSRDIDPELFFDHYENSPTKARVADAICSGCPVRELCLDEGVESKLPGCWGGVWLVNGVPKRSKNMHKTDEEWEEVLNEFNALYS